MLRIKTVLKIMPFMVVLYCDAMDLKNNELKTAIADINVQAVKKAIKAGADVNAAITRVKDFTGQGPKNDRILNLAVRSAAETLKYNRPHTMVFDALAILKLLLENGADVNAKDLKGLTPLEIAYKHNSSSIELLKILLRYGADIHAPLKEGSTYYQKATGMAPALFYFTTVKDFIEDYAQLEKDVTDNPNRNIFEKALKDDYFLLIKKMIQNGFNPRETDLELAKEIYKSKKSYQVLLNQIRLTYPQGCISTTGMVGQTSLPSEIWEEIARKTH